MSKTIRKSPTQLLNEKIAELSRSVEYWKDRCDVFQSKANEFDRMNQDKMMGLKNELGAERSHISQLLEIIRWQANPETTKYPFRMEKNQRDERDREGRFI